MLLRDTPVVIATAYGARRAEAALAAVRGGFVTTLVTDAALARRVPNSPPRHRCDA
jgi:DNA-binding transcriptional regulator LsrR (DeoR family)